MNRLHCVLVSLLVLALSIPAFAQQVKVTVQADRTGAGTLTGDYYAKVIVEGAATARQVVFRLNFPAVYGLDMTPSDIQIVAVRPGADVMSIDANDTPTPDTADDTPVVFAEAVNGAPANGVWIVALMKDEAAQTTKHVCDIVFTSRGRATKDPVAFEAGSVAVKDASLAVLADQGAFGSAQAPILGDINWDGQVSTKDFGFWLQAWRLGADVPLADIFPLASGDLTDPANAISAGDATISTKDFGAWLKAWRAVSPAQVTNVSPDEGGL